MSASVVQNSACRSRWMICVESVAGFQPKLLANGRSICRIEVRMRADRAAQFANANPLRGLRETFFRPAEFVEHQRELQPERDRLRVNAMAPADHRRHLESPRLVGDDAHAVRQIFQRGSCDASVSCTASVVSRTSDDVSP